MGACKSCSQFFLVIINIIFAAIGVLLTVTGCIVRYGRSLMDSILSDWYARFDQSLKNAGVINTDHISDFNVEAFLSDTALVFIIIGVFFLLVGVSGCIGACCEVKCLLVIYTIVVIILIIVEAVFVILLFTIKGQIDIWLKEPMNDALQKHYTGTNGTDSITTGLNFAMAEFDCCGVENYKDFRDADAWVKPYPNQVIPIICCKNTSVVEYNQTCVTHPTTSNAFISKGCYEAISDWVLEHQNILIWSGTAVAAVEILLVMFACVVCASKRHRKIREREGYERY